MKYIIVILSFFLDGLLSIYQGPSWLGIISFKPMFTIVSLVLIYPLYKKSDQKYYLLCMILGLAYDVIYTNTLMLNMFLFSLLGFIISKMNCFFVITFTNTIIVNLLILTIYHLLTYLILCSIGYLPFNIYILSSNFIGIILFNTVFLLLAYSLIRITNNK